MSFGVNSIYSFKGRLYCCICSYSSMLMSRIKAHLLIHSDKRLFTCEVCSKSFVRKAVGGVQDSDGLVLHYLGKFCCTLCDFSSDRKGITTTHVKTHKPFTCSECGKRFSYKHVLKTHLLLHSNVFPYSCPLCAKRFRHKQSMLYHKMSHAKK